MLDPTNRETIKAQLHANIDKHVITAANCRLILAESQSGAAQSFRNYRSNHNSLSEWATVALCDDIDVTIGTKFQALSDDEARRTVAGWQRHQLRQGFDAETPWPVIADWHAENGDLQKAEFCREIDQRI